MKVVKKLIGPHDSLNTNFGLIAGNDLDLYVFFFVDAFGEIKLNYAKESISIPPNSDEFTYLVKIEEVLDTRSI